ncbi:hypothetical protein [Streptomyces sp. NPDC001401]
MGAMDVLDGDYIKADNEWDELVWVWQQTDVPRAARWRSSKGSSP